MLRRESLLSPLLDGTTGYAVHPIPSALVRPRGRTLAWLSLASKLQCLQWLSCAPPALRTVGEASPTSISSNFVISPKTALQRRRGSTLHFVGQPDYLREVGGHSIYCTKASYPPMKLKPGAFSLLVGIEPMTNFCPSCAVADYEMLT